MALLAPFLNISPTPVSLLQIVKRTVFFFFFRYVFSYVVPLGFIILLSTHPGVRPAFLPLQQSMRRNLFSVTEEATHISSIHRSDLDPSTVYTVRGRAAATATPSLA